MPKQIRHEEQGFGSLQRGVVLSLAPVKLIGGVEALVAYAGMGEERGEVHRLPCLGAVLLHGVAVSAGV